MSGKASTWVTYPRPSPVLDALAGLETNSEGQIRLTVGPQHCNSRNMLHGGVLSTYADFAIGHWIEHVHGVRAVTTNLTLGFFQTANVGDVVIGQLEILHHRGRQSVGRCRYTIDDRPIADATATYAHVPNNAP